MNICRHSFITVLFVAAAMITPHSQTQARGNPTSIAADLIGTQWELVSFQLTPGGAFEPLHGERYSLIFESKKKLIGRAADCDDYSAKYRARDGGRVSVRQISSSFVLCAVQSSIPAYFNALASVTNFELVDDELHLRIQVHTVLKYRRTAK